MARKRTSASNRNTDWPSQMRSIVSVPTTLPSARIGTPMNDTVAPSSPLSALTSSGSNSVM